MTVKICVGSLCGCRKFSNQFDIVLEVVRHCALKRIGKFTS